MNTGRAAALSASDGQRWLPVVLIAVIGMVLSVTGFEIAQQADTARVRGALTLKAAADTENIAQSLVLAAHGADAMAVFMAAMGTITAGRFHHAARSGRRPSDVYSALSWSPLVKRDDRASFVDGVRRDGDANYDIRDIVGGRIVPAAERPEYLPELYRDTYDGLPDAAGVDLPFRGIDQAQIARVRDSGTPEASAPLRLSVGDGQAPGFIVLWPVYATGAAPPDAAGRDDAFRGMVTLLFRFDRLLPDVMAGVSDSAASIDIASGSGETPVRHVASFIPASHRLVVGGTPTSGLPGSLRIERDFKVLGQRWVLRFQFAPSVEAALSSPAPETWLILSLGMTILVSFLTLRRWTWWQRVEADAREADDRFRRVFDDNPVGMVLATADEYRFVRVNAAFYRILEYSAEELIGRCRDEFAAPDSVGMPPAAGAGGDPGWFGTDKNYITKTGRIVTARVRVMTLPATSSSGPLVLGLAEDVTEQRKLEAALRQALKMEAIGQLTGGMAHDFNNLLGVIIGNLDLLKPLPSHPAEAEELIDEALAAALRGADLTQSLLAFARRQPLNPNEVAINERVTEIARLLTRTLGERVTIKLDLAADLWTVVVDAGQLESCLLNMATNARDAMPHGGTLAIRTANSHLDSDYAAMHPDVRPGDYAMIEISDTGGGMTQAVVAQIFEPFFTTKGASGGTGLGLSMVFGFIKQSNGHINAYSEPGVGTTFRLYLPRAGASVAAETSAVPMEPAPLGHGEHILVVEDNEQLRATVVRQLIGFGYHVTEADGVTNALAVMARVPVDLVFSDVVMPGGLDGFGLARMVLDRWPSTKVLLTSGFSEAQINTAPGGLAGQVRLLGKPYRSSELARSIRGALVG